MLASFERVFKPGFHTVVTVVNVLWLSSEFATKWKHEETWCRDTLATVHHSYNSVVEINSSSISTTVATG
jgi:hypothetical protein